MMIKRLFCLILCLCIILPCVPAIALAEGTITASLPSFRGSGINEYGGICKGLIRSSVVVTNNTSDEADVMLVAALTERDGGKLVSVSLKNEKYSAGAEREIFTSSSVEDDELYSLKIYCWDGNMNQLCDRFVLEDYNPLTGSYNEPKIITGFDCDETADLYVWADTEHGASLEISSDENGYFGSALRSDYNRQHYGCQVQKMINDDWSGYSGVQFNFKGTTNSIIYARINDGTTTWEHMVNACGDWQTETISFLDFDGINLETIKSITFFAHSNGAADRSGEGYFLIDNLILTSPVKSVFSLGLLTKQLGSCYTQNDITVFNALCSFNCGAEQKMSISYVVTDEEDNTVFADEQELTVGNNEIEEYPFSFTLSKYGCFTISAFVDGEKQAETDFTHIAAIDNTLLPSDGYKQGYSVHFDALKNVAQIEAEADALKMQGSSIVRQDFLWDIIEPEKGQYDWSLYDNTIDILTERNIEMIGLITYTAEWSSAYKKWNGEGRGKYHNYPPENLEEWGRYVYDVVSRYKDRISRWEIWNEANIFYWEHDPAITHDEDKYRADAYVNLLKVSYLAAKAADPNCTVTMSGMSDIGNGFVNRLLENGGYNYMDVLSIHPYMEKSVELTDWWADRNFERKILYTRAKASSLPIYLTEWGWNTDTDTSLENSALWNVKGILYSRACGVEVNTLYSFNSACGTGFGHILPYANGYAKPQFVAVAATNSVLLDRSYKGAVEKNGAPYFGTGTYACYFEAEDKSPIVALWLTDESKTAEIEIASENSVKVYDMYGNPTVVNPVDNTVSIQLDSKPVYIEGDLDALKKFAHMRFEQTARSDQQVKKAVQARTDYYFSTEPVLKKNKPYTLEIRLVNYSGKAISGSLSISGVNESWISEKNLDYNIENMKSGIVSVCITPDESNNNPYTIQIQDYENDEVEVGTYKLRVK